MVECVRRSGMSKTSITLLFPNDTSVKLEGDREVVIQLIRLVDKKIIGFKQHDYYMADETKVVTQRGAEAIARLLGNEPQS